MDAGQDRNNFDYSFVDATARIALYDDYKSAPRIIEIGPCATNEFIEKLTSTIYEQSKLLGGKVPYTIIREVTENFIHAQFREIVVSVMDGGSTIRFADQGPGIREKEKAQKPGYSSAIEPMKKYIRGVGSGFPIVRDYLDDREGTIQIDDNLENGAVITISLDLKDEKPFGSKTSHSVTTSASDPIPPLSGRVQPSETEMGKVNAQLAALSLLPLTDREKLFISVLNREGDMGITDLKTITDTPGSTTFNTLKRLEELGLVQRSSGKKRALTELGYQIATMI